MPSMRVRGGFTAAAFALAACGSNRGESAIVVRDSAGVRIVENRASAAALAAWRVDQRPVVQIGVAEGPQEYQLSEVRGAVRLPGGGVAVANGDSRELRFYDERGRFVRSFGGPGGGPGEFESLDALVAYRGDSIAAWDPRARRLTIVGADGGLGRAATVQGLTSVTARLRAALEDGSFVMQPTGTAADYLGMRSGERRDSVSFLRLSPDGTVADTLARRAAREYVSARSGNLILQRPVLFGRDSYASAGSGRAFVGESDQFRIDVVDGRGAQLMSIRRPGPVRPVSREQLARAREEAERGRERTRREIVRMAGSEIPGPSGDEIPARSTMPAFDRVLVDGLGYLWVRGFVVSSADAPEWSVFDPDGRWVARVRTPVDVEVYQVGPDWILGRGRDEMEVESVRLYRLDRTRNPAS